MWGDEAAERHEMDEPSEPLAVDGTPRLNPLHKFYVDEEQVRAAVGVKQAEHAPQWDAVLDKAVQLARREERLEALVEKLRLAGVNAKSNDEDAAYSNASRWLAEALKVEL